MAIVVVVVVAVVVVAVVVVAVVVVAVVVLVVVVVAVVVDVQVDSVMGGAASNSSGNGMVAMVVGIAPGDSAPPPGKCCGRCGLLQPLHGITDNQPSLERFVNRTFY